RRRCDQGDPPRPLHRPHPRRGGRLPVLRSLLPPDQASYPRHARTVRAHILDGSADSGEGVGMTTSPHRPRRRLILGAGLAPAAGAAGAGALALTRDGDGTTESEALLAALRSGDFTAVPLAGTDAAAAAAERERIIGPLLGAEGAAVELAAGELEETG